MSVPKKEYLVGKKCLDNYYRNQMIIKIKNFDITSLQAVQLTGMPRPLNAVSDSTALTVIRLEKNKDLQNALLENLAVEYAMQIIDDELKYICEHVYMIQDLSPQDIIWNFNDKSKITMSEATFYRRLKELRHHVSDIYKVLYSEVKKDDRKRN